MHNELKKQLPFIQAIVELFHPLVEGALHDLESGKIVALFNNISKRQVGDASPLKELNVSTDSFPDYFPPYYKTNWDGRRLKCTSITVRDDNKAPIGLICFNFDSSLFEQSIHTFSMLLQLGAKGENPIELFGENWQEQIQLQIALYLKEQGLSQSTLTRSQKKSLVQHLYQKGIFNFKNAAPFLADLLGISRASLYNYIKSQVL